ncbi:hypothetical protein LX64_01669 [Chitinophaga skermanii]|uniref:Uncharacterized protein n=1 Tax=Chitinophaga skermanii TaxID=331697 RepID=A0A327QS72_9BACT|nr:hypothetical protein [Chitinophaga skermanii]RAJ06542.1 hypothetical protein LX64_01669 [Chitinophaga skermanii]
MKPNNAPHQQPSKTTATHNNRPEIRDNLDSRKNEEQDIKGGDMTHNKKEHRSEPAKKK